MTPSVRAFIEANQPVSAEQIATEFGITRQSVYEYRQKREVHISEWSRNKSGHSVGLYMLGDEPDAPRPKSMTHAVRSRNYRQRNPAVLRARRPSKFIHSAGLWAGLIV